MKGKFSVVLNAHARSGDQVIDLIRERWGEAAKEICVVESVQAFEKAITSAKKDVGTLIVGGGDGTIRKAAELLLGTDTMLGVLPLGTGNALAHELGIPISTADAMTFLDEQAVPAKIDVGRFNSDVFVNVATLGITSKIMDIIANSPKGKFGRLVYIPALFRAVRFAKSFRIRIESEKEALDLRAVQFVAASSQQHGGPFRVTESASITDGKLSVYVVKKGDRGSLFRYGLGLLFGRHTELPTVWSAELSQVQITLSKTGRFVLDGDAVKAREAEIRVEPSSLNVLVSPESAASKKA
ncbi:MAG: hypothetical protein KF784_15445 [Fimbriimonadaceae bacterium]|nr:hypothetical protein [Fimbriimonadaceae bacterium]